MKTLMVGAAVGALALAGCSSSSSSSTESGADTHTLPPQIVEPSELAGATFEITEEQPLVINVDDTTEWSGSTEDAGVAEFVAGEDDGSATLNPGFQAVSSGETGATLTSPDGETYEFTLVVP